MALFEPFRSLANPMENVGKGVASIKGASVLVAVAVSVTGVLTGVVGVGIGRTMHFN
jgi:hypothetical protein